MLASLSSNPFIDQLEIVPAYSLELKRECFRIRHEVYCEDLGYEPIRASGLETDIYDANALHCLLRDVENDEFIGCMRLVLARPRDLLYPLPIERTCTGKFNPETNPASFPRRTIAEASRLAVRKRYQGRVCSGRNAVWGNDENAKTRVSYNQVGLYLGGLALAESHGIKNVFVLTEPRLNRYLNRLGMGAQVIGEAVEHRGTRVPSMIVIQDLLKNLHESLWPIFQAVREQVKAPFEPAIDALPMYADHPLAAPMPSSEHLRRLAAGRR